MSLMEQYAAEKKAAEKIMAKGENLTAEEQTELKNHFENAKSLEERMKLFEGVNNLDKKEVKHMPERQSIGEFFASQLEASERKSATLRDSAFITGEYKAAGDTHTTSGYDFYTDERDRAGVWPVQRPLVVADLFGSLTLSGETNAITYPVYTGFEGAPAAVAEGGAKPQIHLPAPTTKTDTLKEVAAYWKVTDAMVDDLQYVISEINNHAQYNLQLVEETQILTGTGKNNQLEGILTRSITEIAADGDTDPDRIYKATEQISLDTGFMADAIVMNPADYAKIRLSKDSNGQYFGGGYFAGQYGNGEFTQNPPLWGLRTVVTPAMPEGTALVGAFKAGAAIFRKGGVRVESTNSHATDFTSDLVTFRIRERLGLQVKYPKAFAAVTLGAEEEHK